VQFRESFNLDEHVYLVFEKLGLSLYDCMKANFFKPFLKGHIRDFTKQLCEALTYLHRRHIVHGDIKPENILLTTDELTRVKLHTMKDEKFSLVIPRCTDIRLIDFGTACFTHRRPNTVCTRPYRPVEVVLGLEWGCSVDMWSLGCVIAELYLGVPLFETRNCKHDVSHLLMMENVLGKIPEVLLQRATPVSSDEDDADRQESLPLPLRRPLQSLVMEPDLLDLLRRLLTYDPDKRITAEQVLKHPFVTKHSASEFKSKHGRHGID